MPRERSIRVELPATVIMTVKATNKTEAAELVKSIFGKQPQSARLTSHRDSDNIPFVILTNK